MAKIDGVVKELVGIFKEGGVRTTRFSITLYEKDNDRLETLSSYLQISKQELISKLLIAALDDLEEAIYNLVEKDSNDTKEIGIDDDNLPF
jgi:hypothetical protein